MRWFYVVLGCALLGGLFSVALDWDHIFTWVLHTSPPFIAVGEIATAGRPFHTWYIFLLYSVVVSIGLTSLMARRLSRISICEVI